MLLEQELVTRSDAGVMDWRKGGLTYTQLIQEHDHPMFVVLDKRIHSLHIWLLETDKHSPLNNQPAISAPLETCLTVHFDVDA